MRDGAARAFGDGPSEAQAQTRLRAGHAHGRVRHVLGDLAGAIDADRIAPEVEDAREALVWLTDVRLERPERVVTSVSGTTSVPLRDRNVGKVTLRVYPVEPPAPFAMRRTLVGRHQVNLAGLTAARTWSFTSKDGGDPAWHGTALGLPAGQDAEDTGFPTVELHRRAPPWSFTVELHRGASPWSFTVEPHRGASPWSPAEGPGLSAAAALLDA